MMIIRRFNIYSRPLINYIYFGLKWVSTSASRNQDTFGGPTIVQDPEIETYQPTRPALPIVTSRKINYLPPNQNGKQAWLETLSTSDNECLGMVDLHPDIFACLPRLDILLRNVVWQRYYRKVTYEHTLLRSEVKGGGRKPWPQKGLGKARHGSIRSPIWVGGGVVKGPRGPCSYFRMLNLYERVLGLRSALSVKYSQHNLHIVDSLDIQSENPEDFEKLIQEDKNWGLSVLFVDDSDIMPRNITAATHHIKHFNLMPVYGLNVYSMLKHETLVLTLNALEKIEERLLYHMHNKDFIERGSMQGLHISQRR